MVGGHDKSIEGEEGGEPLPPVARWVAGKGGGEGTWAGGWKPPLGGGGRGCLVHSRSPLSLLLLLFCIYRKCVSSFLLPPPPPPPLFWLSATASSSSFAVLFRLFHLFFFSFGSPPPSFLSHFIYLPPPSLECWGCVLQHCGGGRSRVRRWCGAGGGERRGAIIPISVFLLPLCCVLKHSPAASFFFIRPS